VGSSRLVVVGLLIGLFGAGCVGASGEAPPAPPAPPAVGPGRPAVVVVSEEGRRTTPVARCGGECRPEPVATRDDFFERFASTVSTQTALLPTPLPTRAATTPVVEAAARSLAEPSQIGRAHV